MAIHLSIERRDYEFYGIGLLLLADVERVVFFAVDQGQTLADVFQPDAGLFGRCSRMEDVLSSSQGSRPLKKLKP